MSDRFAQYPSLKGRSIFITGGASGIGRATAAAFKQEGAEVAILDLPGEALNTAAKTLKCIGVPCDVTNAESVKAAFAKIAETFGVKFRVDVERRIEGARKVGAHKTSMLQDLERGRPMEIEAIVRAPLAFARSAGVATPTLDAIEALTVSMAQSKGLYVS